MTKIRAFFLLLLLTAPLFPQTKTEDSASQLRNAIKATTRPSSAPRAVTAIGGLTIPNTSYAQSMIQKYIQLYTSNSGKKALVQTLDDAEPYRLYVRRELKKRKMPAALEYLPVVESNYKPLATSKSGARGIWQFMLNSIGKNLRKTDWIDERLDPWLSTDAALTKLQDNYKTFKDWPLAIAAYNCGAGAMRRILEKSPVKTFWYISEKGLLRDESVQYIPRLIAIAELSERGEDYGITLPEISKSTRFAEFDFVETTGIVFLSRLESELRMEEGLLAKLNPALLYGCTPDKEMYRLRLPSGMKKAAEYALSEITQKPLKDEVPALPSQALTYTVQAKDTLFAISRKFGVSVDALCESNGISRNDILKIGKILYIPQKTAENK